MNEPLANDRISHDLELDSDRAARDLQELHQALLSRPRQLPSKHFYDHRGSALFQQITRLPEYYPSRTERSLLLEIADEIGRRTQAEELVELGAGAATKTRILLDAMQRSGRLRLYVPFDVSETEVRRVASELTAEYPQLHVHGIVADFTRQLSSIPPGQPRLVILLGSTIGNYTPVEAVALLHRISDRMAPGDFFLLGADLIKNVEVVERAYNDASGVTAEFNRNILRVVNRVARADFEPSSYDHLAFYERELERIEMHLVATSKQAVRSEALNLKLEIEPGEALRTEISCKYDRRRVDQMLSASGFQMTEWYTDRRRWFALALARKA